MTDADGVSLFALDKFQIDEEIVHAVGRICSFGKPVLDAVFLEHGLFGFWIFPTQIFQNLPPGIAAAFRDDQAENRLLFLSDFSEFDAKHNGDRRGNSAP